jgi:acetylornithine deacetylase
VRGGDNPNRICADCELQFDLRLLPGMDDGVVRATLRRAIDRALEGSGLSVELAPLHPAIPAYETPASAEIIGVVERLTGAPAEAVPFGTEAPFLARLAPEVVVLGPGDIQVAHQPGERLALARLEPYVRILRDLIAERCAQGRY